MRKTISYVLIEVPETEKGDKSSRESLNISFTCTLFSMCFLDVQFPPH